jgi:hypothetical protein
MKKKMNKKHICTVDLIVEPVDLVFEAEYQPPQGKKISDLMSGLDLGIDRISVTTDFILTVTKKPTKTYIKRLEELLRLAIAKIGAVPLRVNYKYKIIRVNYKYKINK